MTVKVKMWDVLMGAQRQGNRCMVARAIHRADPALSWVNVGTTLADAGGQTYVLPELAVAKIRRWDLGHFVWPFSFQLTRSL
jgi:hypothetical protein